MYYSEYFSFYTETSVERRSSDVFYENSVYEDESDEDYNVIPAIPDPTINTNSMAVFVMEEVFSEATDSSTDSNRIKELDGDDNKQCVCGMSKIPNITLTRIEASRTMDNLISTANRIVSKQGKDYDDYIVNGHKVPQEPWLAVLFHGANPFCGGTIINQRFILTG